MYITVIALISFISSIYTVFHHIGSSEWGQLVFGLVLGAYVSLNCSLVLKGLLIDTDIPLAPNLKCAKKRSSDLGPLGTPPLLAAPLFRCFPSDKFMFKFVWAVSE